MTRATNSAARRAADIRARPRRGWRRVTAWLGLNPAARRADAQAALWDLGAAGETATAGLLAALTGQGWTVRHDRRLPGRRFNLDHVLVAPDGTVIVLDTKTWHRGRPTRLVGGRVCCGVQDRHEQVEKTVGHAAAVEAALGPGVVVLPLLVVHGSPVDGGELAVRVAGRSEPVFVMGSSRLVPRLVGGVLVRDPRRAARVVARVDEVLLPYV